MIQYRSKKGGPMKKKIDEVIGQLESIPVSGLNAIKMGSALVTLINLRDSIPDDKGEGEEECQQ